MKKIIFLLPLIIIFSCKKETSNQIPVLDSKIKSVETIGGAEKYSYYNSDIEVVVVQPISDSLVWGMFVRDKVGIIYFEATLINGIYSLKSLDDKEYFSFKVNSGYASDFKISNPIPFEKLFSNSAIQSVNSYVECMSKQFNICKGSLGCKLLCGSTVLGITGCAGGWSLYCAGK